MDTFARTCRTCGFSHTAQDEGCPRWTAPLFDSLTRAERRELANRLHRAGHRLGDEANALAAAPASVLAAYTLPRETYHDFYSAAIEASLLSVEVRGYGDMLPAGA